MGSLNSVLFMLMMSCTTSVALSVQGFGAPSHHSSSTLSKNYRKNVNAPGIRVGMMQRNTSCAALPMLGPESRSRRFACALVSSSRRQRVLAGRKASKEHIRNVDIHKANDFLTNDDDKTNSYIFQESIGHGEYLIPIQLGTPPQKTSVIVDTGSDLTWIQSQPCLSCFSQTDDIFDPSDSSTYQQVACNDSQCDDLYGTLCSQGTYCAYRYDYGDGSVTYGIFSTETITLDLTTGSFASVNSFAFGASVYSTGTFSESGGGGILGLGQGTVSFPSQLATILEYTFSFSYCLLDPFSDDTSPETNTGIMYLGDAALPADEVKYTAIVRNDFYPTFYYIRLLGITVGEALLPIDSSVFSIDSLGMGGTMIDSGTSFTYLQPAAYDEVVAAYELQVPYPRTTSSSGLHLCFDITNTTSGPYFPLMTIHLDGVDWILPPENTFVFVERGTVCLAFASAASYPFAIIGNIQQQNFDIVYDLDNMRIAFISVSCAAM